ncbi:MAG: flagellar basal body rod protein FlgB [Xanthomonadales bacterium]|nr:flagellar basal body rod protein FlgB [Gammaproteobacteria bacterium]NNK04948.1 flagellar basal body rod protein FlgB [Xanthomonadales bacterium]
MPSSIDNVFGVHAQALQMRARRGELIASNLANADTPNYKARDFDFRNALESAQSATSMQSTHASHIGAASDSRTAAMLYRVPNQASLDGNTVDTQVEQANFSENAVRYQTTLRFLSGKISGLMKAIKGE